MTRSLSILLPAAMGHEWNAVLEHHGMGPHNISVLCWSTAGLMIGCHAWEGTAARYTDPGRPSFMTQPRYNEIRSAIITSDLPLASSTGAAAFGALAAAQGRSWQLPLLPAAGSGATVTVGEFYRTQAVSGPQQPFPVVRVIQTHQRDDESHTDLTQLMALFEPQRDPFRPAPWVAPSGTVGAYRMTNLIGGPERATHNGLLWQVSQTDGAGNNVWAPGEFGWVEV